LAVLVLALGLLAGCSGSSDAPAAPPVLQSGRLDDLRAALAKSTGQPFAYTVSFGNLVNGAGKQDATGMDASLDAKLIDATSGLTVKANLLLVGADVYVKLDFGDEAVPGLGPVGKRWMRADPKQIAAGVLGVRPGTDNLSPKALLGSASSATRVGNLFTGSLDVTTLALPFVGTGAKSAEEVDYAASVDGDGRIAQLTITLPASEIHPSKLVVTYASYGKAVTLTRPAANDTVTAPEMVYQFLR
jgi:hypothetical protein